MKILSFLAGLVLVTLADAASAHAHLEKSSPAEGSIVTTSPGQVVLEFSEAVRLTALSIAKGDEAKQALKPLPTAAAQHVAVPLPALTPGTYSLPWRVLSDDGHMMAGTLHFTVAAERAPAPPANPPLQH